MKNTMFLKSLVFLVAVASIALGAEYPFSDNFSDTNQTKKNWSVLLYQKDSIVRTCANGVYTITNLQKSSNSAFVYHEFLTSKTPTFTASCTITRTADSDTAGMFLCLSIPTTSGYLTGYSVIINNSYISLNKNGASAAYLDGTPFRSLLTDTLKVSKQANTIKIFCNGVFLFSYYDNAPLAPGDFGLIVKSHLSVAFDNVLFTDQFTDGSYPFCINDGFNNRAVAPNWVIDPAAAFTENDSVLVINVPAADYAIGFTRVAVGDTFAARLVVANKGGDSTAFYGLFLYGPDTLNSMPMVFFGITGTQTAKAFLTGTSFSPRYKPQIINGSVSPFNDTIDLTRSAGSNSIIMSVNGYSLDTMPMATFKFKIIGAGIFTNGGVKIFADNFYIGPSLNGCPVNSIIRKNQIPRTWLVNPSAGNFLFDPLGRKISTRNVSIRGNYNVMAPGFYISADGKSGVAVQKK